MKIASANLQMAASHATTQHHQTKESLHMWVGQQGPNPARANQSPPITSVNISSAGISAQSADDIKKDIEDAVDRDPGLNLIRQMLEFLTGGKIRVADSSTLETSGQESPSNAVNHPITPQASGFGIEYDYSESYSETEQTTFAASGIVKTADGKEISFNLELNMMRSYYEETNLSLRLGDAARKVDPLVINFGGTAAQLSDTRFSFDLDSDGKQDQISQLKPGSGFLVFDRNNDGKINNGQEMFGPNTGNGFSELSALDDDHNGWIDENDRAYNELQVWQGADNDSQGALQSLASAGVGAIALTHIGTPFAIKNTENNELGEIRSSGIFLQHNGEAGTIQHVDLTV